MPSVRSIKDTRLKGEILKVYEENYSCYGVVKVWHSLLNKGESVARCTVGRLMKELGIRGAVRGKVKTTTISNKNHPTAQDLVNRNFTADHPNELWVVRFHLCLNLGGVVLYRFRNRCVRPSHHRLCGIVEDE